MRRRCIGITLLMGIAAASVLGRPSARIQGANSQDSAKLPQDSRGHWVVEVEGKWLITFVGPDRVSRTRILTLQRDKGTLTGTLYAPVCPCAVSGSIKGDKMELRIFPRDPKSVKIIYTAKVTGDTMNGESYLEGIGHQGSKFKGIRQAQNESPTSPTKN